MAIYLLVLVAAVAVACEIPGSAFVLVDVDRTVRQLSDGRLAAFRFGIGASVAATATLVVWLSSGGASSRLVRAVAAWTREPYARSHAAMLSGLVAFGAWLRWRGIDLPVSYDEATSVVWFSSRSWIDVVSDHTIPNNHVLHNLLVHLLTSAIGLSPEAIRMPALVAGLLCVPLTYWLVRRLWSPNAALMAAGLAAAAPMGIEYSTQGRGYTMLWAAFLGTFALATYAHDRSPYTTRRWALFAVLTAVGAWAIPTMAYCTATIAIWLVLSTPHNDRVRVLKDLAVWGSVSGFVVVLLYVPVLLRTGLHDTPGPWAELWTYPRLPLQWTAGLQPAFVLMLGVGACAAIADIRSRARALRLLAAGLLAHVALLLVLRLVPPSRVLHYQFFIVAGVACHGLLQAVERLPVARFGPSRIALLLSPVIAVSWGMSRLEHVRTSADATGMTWVQGMEPGAEGIRCCAGGYFVDAEALVDSALPRLAGDDVIVAQDLNGSVETMRFYLLARGRSPVLVHPFRMRHGLDQLAPYGDLLLVVKSEEHVPPSSDYRAAVLPLLGVDDEALRRVYREPELVGTHRISRMFRLRRVHARPPRSPGEHVPFNMFWYW